MNLENETTEMSDSLSNDRRSFLRGTLLSAVATTAAVPALLQADDTAITKDAEWGVKLGAPVDASPYGLPSPYEHNNVRRVTDLLSSGDMYASVAMTPLHNQEGIITPNGLFFNRSHGGVAEVDPNKYRLMIHGLVDKPLVLTLEQLERYPSESRIHFIECPANGSTGWRGPQFNSLQFMKGMMSSAEWTGVKLSVLLEDLGVSPKAKWI